MSDIDDRFLSSFGTLFLKRKARSLVDLCLGVLGQNLEDIIEDLLDVVASFPSDIKMSLAAIARRKKLLNDDVLIALADSSWQLLDISGSNATDIGLAEVAGICSNLRSVDIRGSPASEATARSCLSIYELKLNSVEEDSWEELDGLDISSGAQSLQWLLWFS